MGKVDAAVQLLVEWQRSRLRHDGSLVRTLGWVICWCCRWQRGSHIHLTGVRTADQKVHRLLHYHSTTA